MFNLPFILKSCLTISKRYRHVREILRTSIIWYPGHIDKGIKKINQKIVECDLVIEVHDARIPFTGRTDLIENLGEVKPKILILNKADLIPNESKAAILKKINEKSNNIPLSVHFTQLNDMDKNMAILEEINELIFEFTNQLESKKMDHNVMVAGIPNVGKSTLINCLRRYNMLKFGILEGKSKKAAKVGGTAGITRAVGTHIMIHNGPPRIFVYDTPGIWEPNKQSCSSLEDWLKMAACGCFDFDKLDKEAIADYLLYFLNKQQSHHDFLNRYQMTQSTDNIIEFLCHLCKVYGFIRPLPNVYKTDQNRFGPDIEKATNEFYWDFNKGLLGKFVMDDLEVDRYIDVRYMELGSIFSNNNSDSDNNNFPFKIK